MREKKEPAVRRKRVARVVKVETTRAETAAREDETPLRPSQCRTYMRKELAKEFKRIVEGFVEGAKSGSCQHVKLATELLEGRSATTEARGQSKRAQSGRRTLQRWADEMEQGI